MDRLLYVAMTGARQTLQAQALNNNNLANASTTGFRQDLAAMRSMPVLGEEGLPTRVFAMAERAGTDQRKGDIQSTGRELDVAIEGEGWIAVQAPDGAEAYTRAGDLRLDASGRLSTGSGELVLGEGGPIAVPPAEKIEIGADGTVSIRPVGQDAATLAVVDRIRLVSPDPAALYKGSDGLMRTPDGQPARPDATVALVQGALEGSNVNVAAALAQMIELSRGYETQIKLMSNAADNASASDRLLRLS